MTILYDIFANNYPELLHCAKWGLINNHVIEFNNIEPTDIVHSAYLKLSEKDIKDIWDVKKTISELVIDAATRVRQSPLIKQMDLIGERYCSQCKELKPVQDFKHVSRREFVKEYGYTQCKECCRKSGAKHVKAFRERNPEKVTQYEKERWAKGKDELSDAYLIKLLTSKRRVKNRYTREYLYEHPEIIQQQRESMTTLKQAA